MKDWILQEKQFENIDNEIRFFVGEKTNPKSINMNSNSIIDVFYIYIWEKTSYKFISKRDFSIRETTVAINKSYLSV